MTQNSQTGHSPVSSDSDHCPCGSAEAYTGCCGPYLNSAALPATAEQLMRSRYTAFVRRDHDYLLATWHPEQRPSRVRFAMAQRWLGLQIIAVDAGGPDETQGTVEFIARFKQLGRTQRLHELSRFVREEGRWYYRDGDHIQDK